MIGGIDTLIESVVKIVGSRKFAVTAAGGATVTTGAVNDDLRTQGRLLFTLAPLKIYFPNYQINMERTQPHLLLPSPAMGLKTKHQLLPQIL